MSWKYTYKVPLANKPFCNYKRIKSSVLGVKGEEYNLTREIITSKMVNICQDGKCDDQKNCSCLSLGLECGGECKCNKDLCGNNQFQKEKFKENEEFVEERIAKGIDSFTLERIKKIMPDTMKSELKTYFIKLLMETLKKRFLKNFDCRFLYILDDIKTQLTENEIDIENKEILMQAHEILFKKVQQSPENFQVHSKGVGVFVKPNHYFTKNQLIGEYMGEIYPCWRWFEREKNLKSIKKRLLKSGNALPEFYNMMLERHETDPTGYSLVVIDAKNKGNFVSRLSHSCDPNAKVSVILSQGQYRIGLYALKNISPRDEITFDYLCRTDSITERNEAVCLCGSEICRGSFLVYSDDFSNILIKKYHTLFDICAILLECSINEKIELDQVKYLKMYGIGRNLLKHLPIWVIKVSAEICRFIHFEHEALPPKIETLLQRKQNDLEPNHSVEEIKSIAINESLFLKNKRIQNLAISLDKLSYFLRQKDQIKDSPFVLAPIEYIIKRLRSDSTSLVNILIAMSNEHLNSFQKGELSNILSSTKEVEISKNGLNVVKQTLYRLRDLFWSYKNTERANMTAAGDILHFYAETKCFFVGNTYNPFKSAYFETGVSTFGNGSGIAEHAVYGENYARNLLLNWHKDMDEKTEISVQNSFKGILNLPDIESCFVTYLSSEEEITPAYDKHTRDNLLHQLEKISKRNWNNSVPFWPKETHFTFDRSVGLFGSPFFDQFLGMSHVQNTLETMKRLRICNQKN